MGLKVGRCRPIETAVNRNAAIKMMPRRKEPRAATFALRSARYIVMPAMTAVTWMSCRSMKGTWTVSVQKVEF